MKSRILVIGDVPLVTGFRLAGLDEAVVAGPQDFEAALAGVFDRKEYGIIVVNEKMFNNIDWRLRKRFDSVAYPVVIPMPDISGETAEGDEIRNLIKRALGFDISRK